MAHMIFGQDRNLVSKNKLRHKRQRTALYLSIGVNIILIILGLWAITYRHL